MKIRNGFVSNSSSSSFIIAVKNNATREDIKNVFYEKEKEIFNFLSKINEEDLLLPEFIDQCVDDLMSYKKDGVKLDTWSVSSDTFSGEEAYADLGCFVYSSLYQIDKDFLKIIATN